MGKKKTFDLFEMVNPHDERKTLGIVRKGDNFYFNNINITTESVKIPNIPDLVSESMNSGLSYNKSVQSTNTSTVSPFRNVTKSTELLKNKNIDKRSTLIEYNKKFEMLKNKDITKPKIFITKKDEYWNNDGLTLTPETVRNSTNIKNIEFLPKLIGDDEVELKSDGDD
jgi:hypothetical protein